jgi:hypothetical protein
MAPLKFPLLWMTSRTPTIIGQTHCQMDRYLGYHYGAWGTGLRRKALSVPLATGGAVHVGVQLLAEWIQEWQGKHHGMPPNLGSSLPLEVIAWAATEAAARYEHKARARGFLERGLEAVGTEDEDVPAPDKLPAALETLILEQRTLIEAQVWVFATLILPGMLSQYRILDVEREEAMVLDCTCGLGDGVADWTVHHDRDCEGIVQQGRADLLLEGWEQSVRGQITYDEVKTKATPNLPWEKAWEHSGQLRINMETAGRRLGKKVTAAYIPVLFKGWRGRDKGDPPEAPKYQHSDLIYGWYDPGSPGFREAQWKSAYRFTDDYGKGHTLPKTFRKEAVWDESIDLPPVGLQGARTGASRVERWVLGYLQPHQWPSQAKLLGPFPYAQGLMADTIASVLAEERLWRDDVVAIREQLATGDDRSEVEIATERISRSWQCTSFSGEPCQFAPICNKEPGWQTPETMGVFERRTPHHTTEKAAYEAIGVEFPDDPDDEGWLEDL